MRQFQAYSVNFHKDEEIKTSFSIETTSEHCKTFFCPIKILSAIAGSRRRRQKISLQENAMKKCSKQQKKKFFIRGHNKSKQTHEERE